MEKFSLDGLNVSSARFDYDKLEWMNGVYIRQAAVDDLAAALLPVYAEAGLEAIDVGSFPAKGYEAHTLSVPEIPEGISDSDMRGLMRIKYGVIIAGGLGMLGGKTVRVGHMGNVTSNDLIATMSALEMSLMELGYDMEPGSGLGAAEEVLTTHRTEA